MPSDAETDKQTEEEREQEQAALRAQKEREESQENRARDAELDAARSKAALEESRRALERVGAGASQPTGLSEDQWRQVEAENPGRTREEILVEARKIRSIADATVAPLLSEVKEAKDRAARAEARAEATEKRHGVRETERAFYEKNPALKAHAKDVEDFLKTYPDHDLADSETVARRLLLAVDVVKGRVKEKITTRRGRAEDSDRLEISSREKTGVSEPEEEVPFDPEDLPRGAARLMEDIHSGFVEELRNPEETKKYWAQHRRADAKGERGVVLDTVKEDRELALRRSRA